MQQICNDLAMEHQELDAVVANLDEAGSETMTQSEGWDIKEQIRHLAYVDIKAILALPRIRRPLNSGLKKCCNIQIQ